jgi:hypothetical protein
MSTINMRTKTIFSGNEEPEYQEGAEKGVMNNVMIAEAAGMPANSRKIVD